MTITTEESQEILTPYSLGGLAIKSVVEEAEFFNTMIYGESGTGKTTLAGSAIEVPEMRPVIFLDIEGGTISLRDKYPEVEKVRIDSWDDLVDVYTELKNSSVNRYKTVVLDSVSELEEFGMEEIMGRAVKKAQAEGEERDPDLPQIGEHGKSSQRMRKVIRRFRDLPMNTIFTALERVDVDKKGRRTIKPRLSPKLASQVSGFLDVVLYMYKKEIEEEIRRVVLSDATDEVIAKDRTNRIPQTITDPTMSVIYGYAMRSGADE